MEGLKIILYISSKAQELLTWNQKIIDLKDI